MYDSNFSFKSISALMLCWTLSASAYTLNITPSSQNVELGKQVSVVIGIAGVMPAGLSAYDFNVLFDPAILAFDQAIDHLGLGSAFGLGAIPGSGLVTLSDFSLELPNDLLALQGDSFPLLTLYFDSLAAGTSSLSFDQVTLGDAEGNPVSLASADPARITVEYVQVPEPGILGLLLTGAIAGLMVRRR